MIARPRALLLPFAGLALVAAACQKVPLLAPSGSTITLTAGASALPLNGTTQIVAQVIEPAGTPPHAGTQVTFTTTLGTVQPASVETDINGQAVATFSAGNANGIATITAISGGSSASGSNAIRIALGTAAVGRITLSANPTILPPTGGASLITAAVFDINGNALPAAPVSFSTSAGLLDQPAGTTDRNGIAATTLRTSNQATVTATVGAQGGSTSPGTGAGTGTGTGTGTGSTTSGQSSASVTVTVAGAPTLVITAPSTPPTAGLPSSYTFNVTPAATNGSAIKDVTVNWGDGQTQDLGAVTGSAVVSHTYRLPGAYTITATVTDASGFSVPVSTGVTVNPTVLGLTITPPTTPPGVGLPATFTIGTGTLPAGDAVRNVHVDWGDGLSIDLGAVTGTVTVTHVYSTAGTYTVTAIMTDTAGNSASVSTSVTIIATAAPTVLVTVQSISPGSGVPATVTFQIQVTAPTGIGIQNATVSWGDGQTQSLGGLSGTISVTHIYKQAGAFSVTVTVTDTLGRTTTGSTSVTISQ